MADTCFDVHFLNFFGNFDHFMNFNAKIKKIRYFINGIDSNHLLSKISFKAIQSSDEIVAKNHYFMEQIDSPCSSAAFKKSFEFHKG